jgi:uncharacterized membrane protein
VTTRSYRAGLVFVFLWFFLGGIAHFAFTEAQMRIVPPWLPWPREIVWVTGVLELLGAAGLLVRTQRVRAAWCLFALTIAVTPANVHMLLNAHEFPSVPYALLVARLPLQVALLVLIAWVARRSRACPSWHAGGHA